MKTSKNFKNALSDKSGSVMIWAAGMVLVLVIFAAGVTEFSKAYNIAASAEEMVRKATVTMAVNNTFNAYSAFREHNNNAFETDGENNWESSVATGDIVRQLRKLYVFTTSNGKLVRNTTDGENFTLDVRDVRCVNTFGDSSNLKFIVRYKLEIPFRFMRNVIVTAPIENEINVEFTPLF